MWSKYLSLSWGPGSLKLITKRKISHYRGTQLQWENQIWVGGNKVENGSISSGETFVFFFVEWCLHHWFLHHSIKNLMEVLLRFSLFVRRQANVITHSLARVTTFHAKISSFFIRYPRLSSKLSSMKRYDYVFVTKKKASVRFLCFVFCDMKASILWCLSEWLRWGIMHHYNIWSIKG